MNHIKLPVKPIGWHITKTAFLERIDPEAIAIDLASIDDPSATIEARSQSAALRKLLRHVDNAPFINLKNPVLLSSINSLVAFGLMSQERADIVLTTPVSEAEAYNG